MRKLFFFFLLLCTLIGCHASKSTQEFRKIIPMSKKACDSTAKLTQFFSYELGENIDFAYQPLSLVRASSNALHDAPSIELLKMRAAKECADGIIHVTRSASKNPNQKETLVRLDKTSKKIDSQVYSYTALAIKLQDSIKPIRMDREFIKNYNRYLDRKNQKAIDPTPCEECDAKRGSKGLIIAGAGIALLFGLLVLVSK